MKWLERLKSRGKGLTDTVVRYPLTMVFLAAAAILFAIMIRGGSEEERRNTADLRGRRRFGRRAAGDVRAIF